jgi:hypothetical protein
MIEYMEATQVQDEGPHVKYISIKGLKIPPLENKETAALNEGRGQR